jgi:hypothetical protein
MISDFLFVCCGEVELAKFVMKILCTGRLIVLCSSLILNEMNYLLAKIAILENQLT